MPAGVDRGGDAAVVPVRRLSARAERDARVARGFGIAAHRDADVREAGDAATIGDARGEATCAAVYGAMYETLRENIRALHPALDEWMITEGYGKVLSRPGLDLPRRELCIVAACAARTGSSASLASARRAATSARRADEVVRDARRARRRCSAATTSAQINAASCVVGAASATGSRRMFIDRVVVQVEAGDGGSGSPPSAGEVRVPWADPTAAMAGAAATSSSAATATSRRCSTTRIATRWTARARRARHRARTRAGARVRDVVMPVPLGTVIATHRDQRAPRRNARARARRSSSRKGGRGGKGNSFFATPTHQSPREYQPGEDGEARTLELELKLIADVGLVGQPNAGKSTLLSVISAARPKIADYPFTTLAPNLGVVQLSDRPHVRRRRHSGHHRRRARREGTWAAVPAAHRAHARFSRSSFRSTRWTGRRSTTSSGARSESYFDRARAEAALRRVHEDGPARRRYRAADRGAGCVRPCWRSAPRPHRARSAAGGVVVAASRHEEGECQARDEDVQLP